MAIPPSTQHDFPISILDTDLYKLTMQQAVLEAFPESQVTYRFTNRSKDMKFTPQCVEWVQDALSRLSTISLQPEEKKWLELNCPYFKAPYLSYLESYRFNPAQVSIQFVPDENDSGRGQIEIEITGPWLETILWEVPLMATLSEAYFRVANTDWNFDGQEELAYEKTKALLSAGASFSEFGTRRRRSYGTQDLVMQGIIRARNELSGDLKSGKLSGTSNVHLAHKYGLTPIGTIAHEWTMGIAALRGYERPNTNALEVWEAVYPLTESNALHIALTDTFSSDVFFKEFSLTPERARTWRGLRQDSGDPLEYTDKAKKMYEDIGIDWRQKVIVYSDSLDVEEALKINAHANKIGFIATFGIGTNFTNDFKSVSDPTQKNRALNIVIKLATIDGKACVKISDVLTKNTGDQETVRHVKQLYGLPL